MTKCISQFKAFGHLDADILRTTKITKVFKFIASILVIPRMQS